MKFMKLAIAAVFAFSFGNAYAFHSGGVAECDGCHTMHNSLDGKAMVEPEAAGFTVSTTQYLAGPYLLQGDTQSSACLNCHQNANDTQPNSYHISTPAQSTVAYLGAPAGTPFEMTPGGDFGWVRKSYSYLPRGTIKTDGSTVLTVEEGSAHGHNIIAPQFGYESDERLTAAPGGTYQAANLQCSSCHDPHGKYRRYADGSVGDGRLGSNSNLTLPIRASGSYATSPDPLANTFAVGVYRILGGSGYVTKSVPGYTFTAAPPVAVAPSTYNQSEGTNQVVVAYGSGMSEWCGNCHAGLVPDSAYDSIAPFTNGNHTHPAGAASGTLDKNDVWGNRFYTNYNAYKKTGDLTGVSASAWSTLVPVELGLSSTTANYGTLKARAKNNSPTGAGATSSSQAQCLSCHRAHATGWASMIRWNMENEFITTVDTDGLTVSYPNYDISTLATDGKSYAGTMLGQAASVGRTKAEYQVAMYGRPASQFAPYQRSLCNKCHIKD